MFHIGHTINMLWFDMIRKGLLTVSCLGEGRALGQEWDFWEEWDSWVRQAGRLSDDARLEACATWSRWRVRERLRLVLRVRPIREWRAGRRRPGAGRGERYECSRRGGLCGWGRSRR